MLSNDLVSREVYRPGILQLTSLWDKWIKEDEALQKHFQIDDAEWWNVLWDSQTNTAKITLKQYRYLIQLLANKKRSELNQMLYSLGFVSRPKIVNNPTPPVVLPCQGIGRAINGGVGLPKDTNDTI